MNEINTGGPAFPSGLIDPSTPEDAIQSLHNGMTLRDYFAAKAMQALIANPTIDTLKPTYAKLAYEYADEMMKARQV